MNIIAPQLAKEASFDLLTTFLTDDQFVMEQKLDGNRVMLASQGPGFPPVALTRGGSPYTKKIPTAVRNFNFGNIPPFGCVLDGELVRNASDDYTYWVFDIPVMPMLEGHDVSALDLETRRLTLETFFKHTEVPFRLVPQAKTRDEKIKLVEEAMTNNYEGLLVKRRDAVYHHGGRNTDWLKLKFVTTADVVVTAVRDDGKDSVAYSVFDEHTGAPVDVGRASLIGKEKNGGINVGDVIEVRYLYVGANGRLYQPTVMRKRDDRRPAECTTQQLKWVNKAVMEALPA